MNDSWTSVRLEDIFTPGRGISYSANDLKDADGTGSPFITIKNFNKGGGFNHKGLKTYSGPDFPLHRLEPEALLIANTDVTRDAEIIGAPLLVPALDDRPLFSMDVNQLTPTGKLGYVDPRYIFFRLCIADARAHMQKVSAGSTVLHLHIKDALKFRFDLPPVSEQTKIAQILDTLDTQIQKTEALIAKLEKIKEGLLHDLLTRGIDQDGQLRPTPDQAPELYKESALGLIPRDWEAVKLGAVARIAHGYAFSGAEFTDKPIGPILLTPGNFHRDGGMYFTEGNTKRYLGKVPPGYTLVQGDIVTVMTDLSPQTLILGMTAVVQEGAELLHNQRIGKILFVNLEQWCSRFMSAQMSSPMFRRRVVAKATGTTVRHSSPEKILSEYVVVPKTKEQQKISRIITSYERQISDEKRSSKKLTAQKQGLMDDLLTGRVRVTPLLKDAV
jgi:type I restriction enzyme S subunit